MDQASSLGLLFAPDLVKPALGRSHRTDEKQDDAHVQVSLFCRMQRSGGGYNTANEEMSQTSSAAAEAANAGSLDDPAVAVPHNDGSAPVHFSADQTLSFGQS